MSADRSRFWIIDDDLSFGKSLRRLLNARGLAAEYFGSAQSFLDSVPPGESGYVIADIHMPGLDGFGLLRKMRDLRYDMPIIIVTGHADSDAREQALQGGAGGFLRKPFSEESLMELVDKMEDDRSAA
jgi:two-component system, LuxR family, response regulator FixJ